MGLFLEKEVDVIEIMYKVWSCWPTLAWCGGWEGVTGREGRVRMGRVAVWGGRWEFPLLCSSTSLSSPPLPSSSPSSSSSLDPCRIKVSTQAVSVWHTHTYLLYWRPLQQVSDISPNTHFHNKLSAIRLLSTNSFLKACFVLIVKLYR